jgi:uncharacterized repeat protein (TIGR01451 family)/CSLREA domain-containing protein
MTAIAGPQGAGDQTKRLEVGDQMSMRCPKLAHAVIALTAALAVMLAVEAASAQASGSRTVDSNADPGDGSCLTNGCTLREAITEANADATGGFFDIDFNITGSTTIQLASPLPAVARAGTRIRGDTQPGFTNAPLIELDGSLIATPGTDGLQLGASQTDAQALQVHDFTGNGIELLPTATPGHFIGGDWVFDNDLEGILVGGTSDPNIDQLLGSRTRVYGNGGDGIRVVGPANASVFGTTIGIDSAGTAAGNDGDGLRVENGARVVTQVTSANNGGDGIAVVGSTSSLLSSDLCQCEPITFNNGELGIDLGDDGVTANDGQGDPDTGPNTLQNFPVIDSAVVSGGSTALSGSLDAEASKPYTITFYRDAGRGCDPSGNGEGPQRLGSQSVTTDATGHANFSFNATSLPVGEQVTAISLTSVPLGRRTSELSACQGVTAPAAPPADLALDISDSPDPVQVGEELQYVLRLTNNGPGTAQGAEVTATLPAGVSFKSATEGCTSASGTVTCTVKSLSSGKTENSGIATKAGTVGQKTLTAGVTSVSTDPNGANNTASETTRVITPKGPRSARCAGKKATIIGTTGSDRLKGTRRRDVIAALGGKDRIKGLGRKDLICAGRGMDKVKGGSGNDKLIGQAGADELAGGRGHDVAKGGPGNDILTGAGGSDRLAGGPGNDATNGGPGDDALFGGPGEDLLLGGPGDDFGLGGPGTDRLIGGSGLDSGGQDNKVQCRRCG